MINYIKTPYEPVVTGVENTETKWRVTADSAGETVIEETAFSEAMVNSYFSNIAIPVNSPVYIWYTMKLSNDEIKDEIGPYEYISRDANVTSDIKPSLYVSKPRITLSEDTPIDSGMNIITFESSAFRGDPSDGHLASTWIIKNDVNEIIDYTIKSQSHRYSHTINRSKLNINAYQYIEVVLQHHSTDGATSEYSSVFYNTEIYPFKFIGNKTLDYARDYTFTILPYNINRPNLSKVVVVDDVSGVAAFTFTDVTAYDFTIPSHTLQADRPYRIESYVLDTSDGDYPALMVSTVYTRKESGMFVFDPTLVYNYDTAGTTGTTNIKNNHGIGYMINGSMIVLSNDRMSMQRVAYNGLSETYKYTDMVLNFEANEKIGSEAKLFNLYNGDLILLTRIDELIYIYRMYVSGDTISLANTTTLTIMCDDESQSIDNTSTISEDEAHIYIVSKYNNSLVMYDVDLINVAITAIPFRADIDMGVYNPEMLLVHTLDDGTIASMGGYPDSNILYVYKLATNEWMATSTIPASMINHIGLNGWLIPTVVKLPNRHNLFTHNNVSVASEYMYIMDERGAITEHTATTYFDEYDTFIVEANATLVCIDSVRGKYLTIEPVL